MVAVVEVVEVRALDGNWLKVRDVHGDRAGAEWHLAMRCVLGVYRKVGDAKTLVEETLLGAVEREGKVEDTPLVEIMADGYAVACSDVGMEPAKEFNAKVRRLRKEQKEAEGALVDDLLDRLETRQEDG